MDPDLDRFLLTWIGGACRHVPDDSPFDVLDPRFAGRDPDNRWNAPGQPTFYLAGDHGVALAEFARHYPAHRRPDVGRGAEVRRVYDLDLRLDRVLDLRATEVWDALAIKGAPACFLDRSVTRQISSLVRSTAAQAILVPSVAFLDDPARWVLAVFLEKVPPPERFVTAVRKDGAFRVEP